MTPADRVEAAARRMLEAADALRDALSELDEARTGQPAPDRHARVRALYARGLSDEEIAAELGVGVPTAAQYRRAAGLRAKRG